MLAGLTIIVGLVWRLVPLGLPPFWFKYGGSALWAAMVYWIVAGMMPAVRPWKVAIFACSIAAAVEFSRLLHTPQLDAFRITFAGKLLLGRFFSAWDILAYWMAIWVAAATDRVAMRTKMEGGANSE